MILEEQVKRLEAQHVEAAVKDDTLLKTTENALALARLEVDKNPLLPKIEAEKNLLSLEAAEAEAAQVRRTNALKREAARAERRTLEIRRDRALSALQHAERNAELLSVRAPIDGMVVLRSIWKSGRMGEPQEGEEVRGGLGLLDVVGETTMRVRVRLNQADLDGLEPGQTATVTLDAYPTREYRARLDRISPSPSPVRCPTRCAASQPSSPSTAATRCSPPIFRRRRRADRDVVERADRASRCRDLARRKPGVQVGADWRAVSLAGFTDLDAVITDGVREGDQVARVREGRTS